MVKTDQKKVPSQNFFLARSSRYTCPTFYEKKNSQSLESFNYAKRNSVSISVLIRSFSPDSGLVIAYPGLEELHRDVAMVVGSLYTNLVITQYYL